VNGEDGQGSTPKRGGTAGAASVVAGDNAEDEDDNDEDEEATGGGRLEGLQMNEQEFDADNTQRSMFREYLSIVDELPLTDSQRKGMTVSDMGERYDVWNRVKLRTADVRRLVNQTLSQSVPGPVITVVNSYTKMFAGLLIEGAREVQEEWMATDQKRADGEDNPAYKRLKLAEKTNTEHEVNGGASQTVRKSSSSEIKAETPIKQEQESSSPTQPDTQTAEEEEQQNSKVLYPGGAGGLDTSLEECDRGPLLPDHLRESLRRYKKARRGGTVGFTGLSLEGREVAAPRMGGRRLFR
jgi:transcription initiation factor TFIID subunit 11